MFHVTLIYTCNMKENALASCISYARSHCVKSSVGAGYCLFISVGERTVSSEKKRDKVQDRDSRGCNIIKMINYMFWVDQVGVDPPTPPRVKDPNVIHG